MDPAVDQKTENLATRCRIVSAFNIAMDAVNLSQKETYWGEHTDFPLADWIAEVQAGDTRQGYWEWVVLQVRNKDNQ